MGWKRNNKLNVNVRDVLSYVECFNLFNIECNHVQWYQIRIKFIQAETFVRVKTSSTGYPSVLLQY